MPNDDQQSWLQDPLIGIPPACFEPPAEDGGGSASEAGGADPSLPVAGSQPAMRPDCQPVRGKVRGPANHVLCGKHGHVLDVTARVIIARSLAEYKTRYGKGGGSGPGKPSLGPGSTAFNLGYQAGLRGEAAPALPRDAEARIDCQEGYAKGHYEFSQQSSAAGSSSGMPSNGAAPEEVPQSLQIGGLPAFRYSPPPIPVATAHLETPQASIDLALSLRGNITVTFPNSPPGVSTDIDSGGWRVEAGRALGPLTAGLRVNGIGTDRPSIGVTFGSEYVTTEYRSEPPSMLFIGQVRIDYTVRSRTLGDVAVQGRPGFELRVTVVPHPSVNMPVPVPVPEESWFEVHAPALAAVGAVVLVGIAIALAPETGGGSLLLLAGA